MLSGIIANGLGKWLLLIFVIVLEEDYLTLPI